MKNYEFTVMSSNEEPYYFSSQDQPYLESPTDCIRTETFNIFIKDASTVDGQEDSAPDRQPDCKIIGTYVDGRTISAVYDYLDVCDEHSQDILDAATSFLKLVVIPDNFFLLESFTNNTKVRDSLITRILRELPLLCYDAFYRMPEYILYYPRSYAQNNRQIFATGIPIEAGELEANLKKEMKPFLQAGYRKLEDTEYYYTFDPND